jgi:hypothetical protein
VGKFSLCIVYCFHISKCTVHWHEEKSLQVDDGSGAVQAECLLPGGLPFYLKTN